VICNSSLGRHYIMLLCKLFFTWCQSHSHDVIPIPISSPQNYFYSQCTRAFFMSCT